MTDLFDELCNECVEDLQTNNVSEVIEDIEEETILVVSLCLNPTLNQTFIELKNKIEYIGRSLAFMNVSSLYLSCDGKVINEDDVKKEILHMNRATLVCIGYPKKLFMRVLDVFANCYIQ